MYYMTETENKDYIINLRVSRATYEKIKERAKENSETVSNLIRKAIDDSAEIISDISEEVFGKNKKDFKDVVSYHDAESAKEMECAKCKDEIPSGAVLAVGETKSGKKYYFCRKCRR
jgi:uncharacterized protein (DUF1778 family)